MVAGKCHEILATGCNGFPRGMADDSVLPTTRPEKYPWMIHSEVNAISSSKADLDDATAYVTGLPCNNCLMQMWQNGIRKVVYVDGYGWSKDEQEKAVKAEFLRQSGMILEPVKPDLQWLVDVVLNDDDMRAKAIFTLLQNEKWADQLDECAGIILDSLEASTDAVDGVLNERFNQAGDVPDELNKIMDSNSDSLAEMEAASEAISNRCKEIIACHLNVEISDVNATLASLGADSLDIVEISLEIEDEFNIRIRDDELDSWNIVDNIIASVKKTIGSPAIASAPEA